ncbi:MAG: ABC transporter ATP-binding protein/permease [Lachnospiraceae bacterium]
MKNYIKKINTILQMPIKLYIFKQIKCLIFMVLYTIFSLAFPGFISLIIDEGIKSCDIEKILFYCSAMLVCGLLMILFQYLQKVSFYKLAQQIVYNIKRTMFEKLLERNLKFWMNYQIGDVLRVLENDIDSIQNLLTGTISNLIINFFVAVGITIVFLIINPILGLIILLMAFLFASIQKKCGDKIQDGMSVLRLQMGELSSIINETLNHIATIQMADLTALERRRFDTKNRNVIQQFILQTKRVTIAQLIGMSFNVFGILAVLVVGAIEVLKGRLSIGVLFSLTIYIQRLYGPIVVLGTEYINIKNTKPMIEKILEILENEDSILAGKIDWICTKGEINFDDVSFKYKEKWILQNLTMEIPEKATIGIIGENGSGKSTLIKLLSKLCIPQSGMLYFDGISIDNITYESIKRNVTVIPQECFLPYGTLRDIMEIDSKEKENKMFEFMEKLGVSLEKFPDGLETELTENRGNLSGGEAQKLALIRGLLQNKSIYILDEPTAAMDLESERNFCNIVREYLTNKTVIIVTHRRELLTVCDKIITF